VVEERDEKRSEELSLWRPSNLSPFGLRFLLLSVGGEREQVRDVVACSLTGSFASQAPFSFASERGESECMDGCARWEGSSN